MDIVIYSLMFFALTCIGSFIGVCFERIPEGESIIKGRSHCESCGKTLRLRIGSYYKLSVFKRQMLYV